MNKTRKGFTLIELLVVVLIIGILASIGIPQYFKVVEKSRIAEAQNMFTNIRAAQERALAREGVYTNDFGKLDIILKNSSGGDCTGAGACRMRYYSFSMAPNGSTSYTITATRITPPSIPARYGSYAITYAGPAGNMTCSQANCQTELIN